MHVLLDLVPGHTSIKHYWFQKSMDPQGNEYSGRYIWSDNAWTDVAGFPSISGSLRGISQRNGSVATNFFSHQPALNYGFAIRTASWQSSVDSPEAMATRQAIKDIMAFWLERGCDGFRVDMAGSLVKNDPGSVETIKLWQDMRAYLDSNYPNAVLISEWGEPDKALQGGFHMDFLLHFGPSHYMDLFRCDNPYFSRNGKGDASKFVETYMKNYRLTNGKGLICIPSGNHDMIRLRRYLNMEEMKIAYAFLLSMPGAPFIYCGDEIGMRHLDLTSVEGGYERTGARTPMQWDKTKNYGFSEADPSELYTEQDGASDAPTVEAQMGDGNSLWREVAKLIALRRATPQLSASSAVEFIFCEPNQYPLVYLRYNEFGKVLVALNPSSMQVSCPCSYTLKEILYTLGATAVIEAGTLTVPACSAAYIEVE